MPILADIKNENYMKINIAVLNYSGRNVTIYNNVEVRELHSVAEDIGDVVEEYLEKSTEHRVKDVSYMTSFEPIEVIYE